MTGRGAPEEPVRGELERRIVTVMFCDLAGFTSLSERLDAEDVAIVQEAYFDAVRNAVTRHGGTLEKFVGDAAVAVFGVPSAGEHDAERAVRCGLAVVGAIEQLAARVGLEEGALHVRVGVNTGEAVVHPTLAAGDAMVTGDVVNTAARLQSAAPLNGVLVGPETALAVAHAVELDAAEELELKGKAERVRAARAAALLPEPQRERAMGALRAPTIGREEELALVTLAMEACAAGAHRRVTVIAPPGTGKSRLLEEVAELASARGAAVRRARVRPDALSAFRPVVDLVEGALTNARIADDHALRAALARALGEERGAVVAHELTVLRGASEGGADEGEGEARRSARFAAWSSGLAALADGRPEVWLVEDVHWSGSDYRTFLASATDADGRLVVCTSRPSILEADAEWVRESEVLALEPLSTVSTAELVRALVGDALPEELVARMAESSGGNPLFVEELLRSWVGSGLLEQSAAVWRLGRSVDAIELPTTVQSVYAAQLDDLPGAARSVIRRASVAGRQFPRAVLGALGADDAEGVAALERRGILRGPIADDLLGDSFVIRHALLRDVGYASLSRAERARLHVRMARWLEEEVAETRPDEVAEVIGRHYAAALESAPTLAPSLGDGLAKEEGAILAAGWFERAGRAALAAAAYDAARGLFERAIELTASDAPAERARRLVGFARATAFTADMAAGVSAAEEALALYRGCLRDGVGSFDDMREEASRAVVLVGTIYAQQLRFHDLVSLASEALAALGDREDAVTARLLLTRIRGAGMIGDAVAWRETGPDRVRALEIAHAVGDPELELDTRMWTVWDESDLVPAWTAIEQLATQLRRWPDVADARRTLAGLRLPDDLDGTIAAAARLASFAVAHQLDESSAWADYYRAEAEFARGDWDAALDAGLRTITVAEEKSYHRVAVRTWHVVVPIAGEREARATLERAVRWYQRLGDGFPDTQYARIVRAAVDVRFGRAGVAPPYAPDLDRLALALAIDDGGDFPSWFESLDTVLAEALRAGEVTPAARSAVDALAAKLVEKPSSAGEGMLALFEARLAATGGDLEAVRDSVRALRSAGAPWPLLKCLRLLVDGGVAEPAELGEARALEERLGIAGENRPRASPG